MGGLLTGVDGAELRGKSEQEYAAVLQAAGARAVFEVNPPALLSRVKGPQGFWASTMNVLGFEGLRV